MVDNDNEKFTNKMINNSSNKNDKSGIKKETFIVEEEKTIYDYLLVLDFEANCTNSEKSIDVVTCMFALHEMPKYAQINVINNAIKIAKEQIIFVDISPNYKPKELMLTGEPYLLDYLKNIKDIFKEFEYFKYNEYIKNHVAIWIYNV